MKKIIICMLISLLPLVEAKEYTYRVVENDQVGIIMLSLGHKKLWNDTGIINQFKNRSKSKFPKKLIPGIELIFTDDDIVFKDNVLFLSNELRFVKKIKTLDEYNAHLINQTKPQPAGKILDQPVAVNLSVKNSFDLFVGAGAFVASNKEQDTILSTSTFTGIQPMLQVKGIYSSEALGSLAIDVLTKKIINDKFSFPVNFDFRVQYVPKWNISDDFRLALSHSDLRHSYVGKNNAIETSYKLSTSFVGLGFIIPNERFWFELYVEKAYRGQSASIEQTQKADNGIRVDTELVYSIGKDWRVLPGINYYQLKNSNTNYKFSVLETRIVLAHEFNFFF